MSDTTTTFELHLTDAELATIAIIDATKTHDQVISELTTLLGIAVQVELATIPIYLYTYYSINRAPSSNNSPMNPPGGSTSPDIPDEVDGETAQRIQVFANQTGAAIMSVAVEEMLHMSLSSNILFAVGGEPMLYGQSPWPYPTNLKGHNKDFRPYWDEPDSKWHSWEEPMDLDLAPLSYEHCWNFIQIEWPEDPGDLPEAGSFDTIGQVYSYIRCLICSKTVTDADFQVREESVEHQIQPGYYSPNNVDTIYPRGSFDKNAPAPPPGETTGPNPPVSEFSPKGQPPQYDSAAAAAAYEDAPDDSPGPDQLMTINSRMTAIQAIATICDQGEGLNPGRTIEGTADPLGLEDSHYYKFVNIQAGIEEPAGWDKPPLKGPAPKPIADPPITAKQLAYFVYPYPVNPSTADYTDSIVQKISDASNGLYQYMLLLTEAIFRAKGLEQKMLFYKGMHNSMIWMLDKLLQAMRKVSLVEGGQLAPTFENLSLDGHPDGPLGRLKQLAKQAYDAIGENPGGRFGDIQYYLKNIFDPPSTTPALPDVRDYT